MIQRHERIERGGPCCAADLEEAHRTVGFEQGGVTEEPHDRTVAQLDADPSVAREARQLPVPWSDGPYLAHLTDPRDQLGIGFEVRHPRHGAAATGRGGIR